MRRPTILFVTERLPYPLDHGLTIRQFHLLTAYAECGNVEIAFFYERDAELGQIAALHPYCTKVHPVHLQTTNGQMMLRQLSGWRRQLQQVFNLQPMSARLGASARMREVIGEVAASADLVHIDSLWMVSNVEHLLGRPPEARRCRFVLDLDDVETVRRARQLRVFPGNFRSRLYGYFELARIFFYQAQAVRLFDRVFVCSELDRARFRGTKFVVVPNGAQMHPAPSQRTDSDAKTILFCGRLSYYPNIDAVMFLTQDIFPTVRHAVPGVRLLIVGSLPGPEICQLDDGESISVVANVPDMNEYFLRSTILVVPLRVAGGTRVRILEALACRTPVVSTTIGCEGIEVHNREHLLIADDASAFSACCIELLQKPTLRDELASRGWQLVAERYSWSKVKRTVVELTSELITGA